MKLRHLAAALAAIAFAQFAFASSHPEERRKELKPDATAPVYEFVL